MSDEAPAPASPEPPKLGLAGRLAERWLGPLLEKPGKRATDYRRADTSTRAVLALVAALAGIVGLVKWQAENAAASQRDQRQAYEALVDKMLHSLERTSDRQQADSDRQHAENVGAIKEMSAALRENTATMREAVRLQGAKR
jgi:hypothetical protein